MTKKRALLLGIIVSSLLMPSTVLAARLTCPISSKPLQVGMSVSDVEAACGKATQVVHRSQVNDNQTKLIDWTYLISTNATGHPFNDHPAPLRRGHLAGGRHTKQTSFELQVSFTADKRVAEIDLGGQSVQSVSVCNRGVVAIGNSAGQVEAACGTPNTVKQRMKIGKAQQANITELIYKRAYVPTKVLEFINGQLVRKY